MQGEYLVIARAKTQTENKMEKYYLIVFDLFNYRKKLIRETKRYWFFKNESDSYIYRISKRGLRMKLIANNYQFWSKTAITVIEDFHH